MVAPLRHRQTKEAETDMFDLQPPRHISTLHNEPHRQNPRLINFGHLRKRRPLVTIPSFEII